MSEASWLEVSLTVDGELAEAVAEVLARFAPSGVAIESTSVVSSPDDVEGSAVGPLRVCAYLPVDAELENTRHRLEEALWFLGRIRPLPPTEYRLVRETDWSQAWKRHYRPIAIGERLIIVPAWLESPAPERIPIRIGPGMAFGTGTHPTTQMCLELLEVALRRFNGKQVDVIDIGCGSGILSIAALILGAARALGVDIDSQAIAAAQQNAQLNGVSNGLELRQGSVAEVLQGRFYLRRGHILLANILSSVIIDLLEQGMAELLHPGGAGIFSGILAEQESDVIASLERKGLRLDQRRQQDDWVALLAIAEKVS